MRLLGFAGIFRTAVHKDVLTPVRITPKLAAFIRADQRPAKGAHAAAVRLRAAATLRVRCHFLCWDRLMTAPALFVRRVGVTVTAQKVLEQRRYLHHLITQPAQRQHGARVPVVHVQRAVVAQRGVLQPAELTRGVFVARVDVRGLVGKATTLINK